MSKTIIDDYFEYQEKYQKQYGSKTLFFMQVGSFFEAYQTLTQGYDLSIISNLLNILVSKKNKSIVTVDKKNPYMMGFPCPAISKFLKVLIDNGYTIILCEQVTPPPNPRREVTEIYSPGTYLENTSQDNNYILSIFIEEITQLKTNQHYLSILYP